MYAVYHYADSEGSGVGGLYIQSNITSFVYIEVLVGYDKGRSVTL